MIKANTDTDLECKNKKNVVTNCFVKNEGKHFP